MSYYRVSIAKWCPDCKILKKRERSRKFSAEHGAEYKRGWRKRHETFPGGIYEVVSDPGPCPYRPGARFPQTQIEEMCKEWGVLNNGAVFRRVADGVLYEVRAIPYHRAKLNKYSLKRKSP